MELLQTIFFILLLIQQQSIEAKLSRKTYSVWDVSNNNQTNKESVPPEQPSNPDEPNNNKGDLEQTLENFKRSIFYNNRRRAKKSQDADALTATPTLGKASLISGETHTKDPPS